MFRPTTVAQINSHNNQKYYPISQSTVSLCQSHIPTVSTGFQCCIRGSNVLTGFYSLLFFHKGRVGVGAGLGLGYEI